MDRPINPDDYEDVDIDDSENPEWTEADFALARPLRDVLPDLHDTLTRDNPSSTAPARKAS